MVHGSYLSNVTTAVTMGNTGISAHNQNYRTNTQYHYVQEKRKGEGGRGGGGGARTRGGRGRGGGEDKGGRRERRESVLLFLPNLTGNPGGSLRLTNWRNL